MRFAGRVLVCTGSTRGIGLAICRQVLEEGGRVLLSSRKPDSVQRVTSELAAQFGPENVHGVVCHVGKEEDRMTLVKVAREVYGRVDLLVLNAAVSPNLPTLLKTDERAMDKLLSTNVTAQFLLSKAVVPLMPTGSSIVLVSSAGAYNPGFPHPAYGISKTAVNGLTKALAAELGGRGIRVNCVAPGMVKTDFSKPLWQNPQAEKMVADRTILKRLGEAEEVGKAVAFLLSDDASYITSETLVVAGGLASRL